MLGIPALLKSLFRRPRNPRLRAAANAAVEQMEARRMLSGNGLAATYFDNADLTGKSVSRTDATVNFNWNNNGPAAGIAADTFSARWTGQVQAQKTETYTFTTKSDDGVRLWVNGKQLVNDWNFHAATEKSGSIALTAGQKYDIKVEYFDRSGGASMQLSWASPTTAKQVIPQAQLFSTAPVAPATPAPAPVVTPATATGSTSSSSTGGGNGLLATYYDNADFTGKTLTRTDPTVNFTWGQGAPASGFGADNFSARWTGKVLAPKSDDYTFFTNSDDGVRVTVNGVRVIDNWVAHAPTENAGKIHLDAGKKYDISVEYYERSSGATMQLKWASPSIAKQAIPQSQLFASAPSVTPATPQTPSVPPQTVPDPTPAPTPTPTPVPTPSPTNAHGLMATYYDHADFTGTSISRVDDHLQFDWGPSSPHEVIGKGTWSARWQGQVQIDAAGAHTFYLTSDGAARLYVDGQLVVNDFGDHGKRESSGTINLSAGRHDIRAEFVLTSESAVMQMRWSGAGIPAKDYVPASHLYAAAAPTWTLPGLPPTSPFTGYKTYTNSQVNFRPSSPSDKSLTVDGVNISHIPIDNKGLSIQTTDLQPGQKAWAYNNITVKNAEISYIYRTPGYHNDFIRIAGAAGHQDAPINVTLENIKIHDGEAIPVLITDGDYDTIVIRNVSITNCTVNQLQINTQKVGTVKRVIVENCPGLSVAIMGRPGTIGQVYVKNSPGAKVSDALTAEGTKSGATFTIVP